MTPCAERLEELLAGYDRIAIHLPAVPERDAVVAACERMGARVVPLASWPPVVVTADGELRDGVVVNLKDEVDATVPEAERVIVLRLVGGAPLAPTMDAYLDVTMIPGRDVWLSYD